ncbi:MAG: hypothetical protein J5590_00610 [Clostridia bacterium]|nr:hypothetical protein [Clostridia bacterium]
MKDSLFIIKCSLPCENAVQAAVNELKSENINTDKISVYTQNSSPDTLFPEIYNVPVFFGATTDTAQNTSAESSIGSALIMTASMTGKKNGNKNIIYFSMPVNGNDLKKAVLILKRSHAEGMKALKL